MHRINSNYEKRSILDEREEAQHSRSTVTPPANSKSLCSSLLHSPNSLYIF